MRPGVNWEKLLEGVVAAAADAAVVGVGLEGDGGGFTCYT